MNDAVVLQWSDLFLDAQQSQENTRVDAIELKNTGHMQAYNRMSSMHVHHRYHKKKQRTERIDCLIKFRNRGVCFIAIFIRIIRLGRQTINQGQQQAERKKKARNIKKIALEHN
jgi:hypothetical protein